MDHKSFHEIFHSKWYCLKEVVTILGVPKEIAQAHLLNEGALPDVDAYPRSTVLRAAMLCNSDMGRQVREFILQCAGDKGMLTLEAFAKLLGARISIASPEEQLQILENAAADSEEGTVTLLSIKGCFKLGMLMPQGPARKVRAYLVQAVTDC